tara:strand:+ start:2431 stop:3267 length:837 start_codon:yes stop_codon:yes gene_type:complete
MKLNIKNSFTPAYQRFIKRGTSGITAASRVLPDFIVIGTVRSGSTSLYYNICEHPVVLPAAYDEIGFFDSNFHLGLKWYQSMFPKKSAMEKIRNKTNFAITGEDTPFYFWKEEVPKRIQNTVPKCKLITILRNPVDRAYSNYHLGKRSKRESLSFEDAIHQEMQRIENGVNREHYDHNSSYLTKGLYDLQLMEWYNIFPKEKILVISTEELSQNPVDTMNKTYEFLEIPEYKISNPQKRKLENYEKMSDNIRNELISFFKPHNEKLFEMINKRFDWNK